MSDDTLDTLKATVDSMQAEIAKLRKDVTRQQDIHAIRTLHFKYGYFIDQCRYDEAVDLFAEDGMAYFHNGIYKGKDGVRRLYAGWFREMFTRGVNGPIEGFLLDHFMGQDIVDVADDGRTAWLRGRCIMQAGYHESVETLAEGMPQSCWEGGIHENTYVKENGVWKIKILNYNMLWQADHAKGWGASSVHLPPIEKTWPDDPNGPDELTGQVPAVWPKTRTVPYHYAHPVSGRHIPYKD